MVYADHAATTPCLPEVADLVAQLSVQHFGNPSSRHYALGRDARAALDTARQQIATALTCGEEELIFTSGATESCNLAIIGVMQRLLHQRPRILVAATEHPAVLESAAACARAGGAVVELPVDRSGRLDLDALSAAVDERTALVATMLVNNETGVIHDLPAISAIARRAGALVLCDATQALGRIPFAVADLGCDLLVASGHKVYGPKGTGLLWLRRGLAIEPLMHGGGQERGLRPGTENVPGIAGMGLAVERISSEGAGLHNHLAQMQNDLEIQLHASIADLVIYGQDAARAPGTSFIGIPGLRRGLLAQLASLAVSGGSSCASGQHAASHVLRAMGVSEADAANAIRISLGRDTTATDVATIASTVAAAVARLRD